MTGACDYRAVYTVAIFKNRMLKYTLFTNTLLNQLLNKLYILFTFIMFNKWCPVILEL